MTSANGSKTGERTELTGEFLYKLKQSTGRTRAQVCELVGLTMGQVGGRIYRYEQTLKGAPPEKPDLFNIQLGAPMELDDDWIVINDVQCPSVDEDMARLVVPVAQSRGIRNLIINGDFINADWLSGYPVLVPHPTAEQEIKAAAWLLEDWLRYFDRIVIHAGNHEDRFLKIHVGNLDLGQLIKLMTDNQKVKWSNFDHCWINSLSGRWIIAHGRHYSVNQLVVAEQYANKFQSHVILGHQHHLAYGWDRWKHWMLVDNGGLFDQSKMAYVTMRASKMPNMKSGFTALVDGVPTLYGHWPVTNWEAVFDTLENGNGAR